MNHKQSQKCWSMVGLFMIVLIVTLPFHAANVLAVSVHINANEGEDHIKGFIDAQGDSWTVEATIADSPEQSIDPASLKVKIGNHEAEFTSCNGGVSGIVCKYLSPLTEGVQEADYAFQVIYNFVNSRGVPDAVSDGAVIKADGSGPSIDFTSLQENGDGKLHLDFMVNDKVEATAPAVGIKTIEIMDADDGKILQSIAFPQPGKETYHYAEDSSFGGVIQAQLSGEGQRRIKLHAIDWLGHESSQNPARSVDVDFVAPEIKDNLQLLHLDTFIGKVILTTDFTVDVLERNLYEVKAFSTQAAVNGNPGTCDLDAEIENLWHCQWKNIEIKPSESIAITFQAKDEFGNTAERTLSRSFTPDTASPVLDYFGTVRTFQGKNFLKQNGVQRILVKAHDDNAGLSEDSLRLNLLAFGKSSAEAPTSCTQEGQTLTCIWEVTKSFGSSGSVRLGLSKFEDNVGNRGETPEIEAFIDNAGPAVESVNAVGVSDIGEKNYFQSNDRLNIKIRADEITGLVILVNLNDVVMDAQTKFPESEFTTGLLPSAGWQVITEENCKREESKWNCEIVTDPIKSGPASATFTLLVRDTAGNEASSWPDSANNAVSFHGQANGPANYNFEILGLSEENNPDYWETQSVKPLLRFIDLDTAVLTPMRMPIAVGLTTSSSSTGNVKVLDVKMQGCTLVQNENSNSGGSPTGLVTGENGAETSAAPAAMPAISRSLVYSAFSSEGESSPKVKLMVEFQPFDARGEFQKKMKESGKDTVDVPVSCVLKIFSKVGNSALHAAETQTVIFSVHFGFSALGAMDKNLEEKVNGIKHEVFFEIANALKVVNEVFQWIRWAFGIVKILGNAINLLGFIKSAFQGVQTAGRSGPWAAATDAASNGACQGANAGQVAVPKVLDSPYIRIPIDLMSCDPTALQKHGGGGWASSVGKYQEYVLKIYNIWSGRSLLGLPAVSLYENIYVSTLGLCVPGILYNLEKYRQVRCRAILCYEKEIPAGIATPDSCANLDSYLTCRYWSGGGGKAALPLIGAWDAIVEFVKGIFSSPLGIMRTILDIVQEICGAICPASTAGSAACSFTVVIIKLFDIVDAGASLFYSLPSSVGNPYCGQVGE